MAQSRFSKALKNQWTSDSEEENETALSPTLGEENSYNSGRGNTEPIYFTELCRFYVKIKGLVKVIPQGNPGIESMIDTARRELKASRRAKGLMSPLPYEKAYILIDRDHFANEPNGISRLVEAIKSIAPNENIEIILSSPCFEFWFFLHTATDTF